jgi:hypothetical protein
MADLRELAALLDDLDKAASPRAIEAIDAQDVRTANAVREILERAPAETVHLVGSVVARAGELEGKPRFRESVALLAFDPRSLHEAATALRYLHQVLKLHKPVAERSMKGVDALIEHRVLGVGTLASMTRALYAAGRRPGKVRRTPDGVAVADEALNRSRLERAAESYRSHDATWIDRALGVEDATMESPGAGDGSDSTVGMARSLEDSGPSPSVPDRGLMTLEELDRFMLDSDEPLLL